MTGRSGTASVIVGQMASSGLLSNQALGGVLGADIDHFNLEERITLLKKTDMTFGELAAPGVNIVELSFFLRAFLKSLLTLGLRQFCELFVKLVRTPFRGM